VTPEELVAFAEGLSRTVASGGGPRALADYLARRAAVGVLVEDAEWRHVAAAGGKQLPSSVRPLLDDPQERRFGALRNGYAGRSVAIVAGDARVGQLSIFGAGDLDAYEHFARLTAGAIGVEFAREAGGHSGRRRAFWERLISGEPLDAAAARDEAAARGITPATHYIAICLEVEIVNEDGAAADRAKLRAVALEALHASSADAGVLERSGMLVMFIPASREIDAANARTAASLLPRTLAKKAADVRMSAGVGTRLPFASLAESLAQAQAALSIARRLFGIGSVGVYDDLGAYPLLLAGADAKAMREFSLRTLTPLRNYDEKHQTELERTLRLYFSVGQNVKTAAAELNVHRHTVFYRLRQSGEIAECKLDDPHDQLTLRMALAIDALTR